MSSDTHELNTHFLTATVSLVKQKPEIAKNILGMDDETIAILEGLTPEQIRTHSSLYAPLLAFKMHEHSVATMVRANPS